MVGRTLDAPESRGSTAAAAGPLLSLILCSRNDEYMGNSRWRLETCLNYVAARVHAEGRSHDVEVLVSDWGSEVPLCDVVRLTPLAAAIVRFLSVPPDLARALQRDSPFAEVLALNAVARRARGRYIGRIDQDTLVGANFVKRFFESADAQQRRDVPLDGCLLFSNRRDIPYRFAAGSPPMAHVERFVDRYGSDLPVLRLPDRPYWTDSVGIVLIPRDLWFACGGYDERLLYYNWMEVDMIGRLKVKYPVVDLGALLGCDFYHLEHVHPGRRGVRHAQKNVDMDWHAALPALCPNDAQWGLAAWPLAWRSVARPRHPRGMPGWAAGAGFGLRVLKTRALMAWDHLSFAATDTLRLWTTRMLKAWRAVRSEPPGAWPRVVAARWASRTVRRVARS